MSDVEYRFFRFDLTRISDNTKHTVVYLCKFATTAYTLLSRDFSNWNGYRNLCDYRDETLQSYTLLEGMTK